MRLELGPAAADVLFVLAGLGILNAVGLLRGTLGDALAAVGLAFLAGVSFNCLIGIVLLVVGLSFTLPVFVVLALATAAVGLGVRRGWLRTLRWPRGLRATARQRARAASFLDWVGVAAVVGFVVYAAYGFAAAAVKPLSEWDSWSIWGRKATALFYDGSLPVDMFTRPVYGFMHPDYPLLVPLYESIQFRSMGGIDTQSIHAQFWLLLVTFVWAVLYLGARRGALRSWLPLTLAAAVAPGVYSQLLTGYADIPMAIFLGLGVLLLAEWLQLADARLLALAVLFLGAAANTKNEGLVSATLALVVAGAIVVFGRRRPQLRTYAYAGAGYLAAILPWRLWVLAHHLPASEIPYGKVLRPSYLSDRADRIWPSVQSVYTQLIDQNTWLYVLPLACALAIASVISHRRRDLAAFFFATGALYFLVVIWVDWVSSVEPLSVFLQTSSYRLVAALMAISLAAVLEFVAPSGADEPPD